MSEQESIPASRVEVDTTNLCKLAQERDQPLYLSCTIIAYPNGKVVMVQSPAVLLDKVSEDVYKSMGW